MRESVHGPNYSAGYCEPDFYASTDGRNTSAGVILGRAGINSFQYRATGDDMPLAGHHSMGVDGPSARANFGVSTNGIGGMAQVSAGSVSSEVGYVRGELNPNLTTGATFGRNGFETRLGGVGGSISRDGVGLHTPIGSVRVHSGIIPFFR